MKLYYDPVTSSLVDCYGEAIENVILTSAALEYRPMLGMQGKVRVSLEIYADSEDFSNPPYIKQATL